MKITFILLIFLLSAAGYSPLARAQSSGTFTATAAMATARSFHTATLLRDARVLIAGGVPESDPSTPSSRTEIYDRVKQTFTQSGNMTIGRSSHTATLLPDGRVLIVGGDSIGTAELYEPSTGSFTATGSLLTARRGFNATLLANGRVLIAGGVARCTDSACVIGDAELYDPSTGVFTTAGSYAGSLASLAASFLGFGSTSTLLPDGTVLFATAPSALVYDPASGAFSLKGAMVINNQFSVPPFVDRAANLLLNGRVLTAGGYDEAAGRLKVAELYDAASGVFTPTGSMTRPRDGHTATLLPDGSVLVAGGESQVCDSSGCFFSGTESSAELYDPAKGAFTDAGNMTVSREWHTATLLNSGEVLITGGTAYGSTASAELYQPASVSPPPTLFSLAGDGMGQGAIWHAATGQLASPQATALAGEILSMYVSGLAKEGAIPPEIAVGGRLADIAYFGAAPGYPGYSQVNFRVPDGVAPGSAVPVRLIYLGRSSNEVSIGVQ